MPVCESDEIRGRRSWPLFARKQTHHIVHGQMICDLLFAPTVSIAVSLINRVLETTGTNRNDPQSHLKMRNEVAVAMVVARTSFCLRFTKVALR